jgi:hypothetical protein
MPISDIFTGSGTATVSSVAATPIASITTAATKRAFFVGIRVGIGATSYAAGNCLFQLWRSMNTPTVGTTGGGSPNDSASAASLSTFLYAGGTAYTVSPSGTNNLLWQQELPQTTGSSWEEFPPLGYEYVIPVSSGVFLSVTAAGTAASQTYVVEFVWSE